MLEPILSDEQRELLAIERRLLAEVAAGLERTEEATDDDRRALADSILQLDELFLIVVVGEFNAGKSAFVNALLGEPLLA
ncbi:MAG: dynamin family protein, partial [Thermoanaerobaculales bacterium]|nr:dynamin family protein [Thermoanaerobaculales bacterium]